MGSDVKEITVKLLAVSSDAVGFKLFKDGEPVSGVTLTLCSKAVIPESFSAVTDESGTAFFYPSLMSPFILTPFNLPFHLPPLWVPIEAKNVFEATEWLFFAHLPNSEYAVWKDNAKFELGSLYSFTLKRYTKAPEFFVRMQLSDVIGAELFSGLAAQIESAALGWAGLKVTRTEGVGTKIVTVYFTLPFSESSPIVIEWAAVWFIIKVITVVIAVIAILLVVKWTFGEYTPAVVGGGLVLLGLLALAALAPKAPERREERAEVPRLVRVR